LKGAVKFIRVPTERQNEQNSLKCTGCGPSLTGRATTGSMVRQRSMRRKPLYLLAQLSLWLDGAERLRRDLVWLYVLDWKARNSCQMGGYSFYPHIQSRQG